MSANKNEQEPVSELQIQKKSRITQLIFVLLFLLAVVTLVNQIKPSLDTGKTFDSKTYIELPDRKPLPVVALEQAGKGEVSTEIMKGKWHILLFGYTFCPDVCPVELTVLHQMMDILRQQLPAKQLPQTVFISVDPDRDTPEMMAEYVAYFDPDFIGLTGKKIDLKILTMPFGISWMKQKNTEPSGLNSSSSHSDNGKNKKNYLISHTTTIILVNPEMKVAGLFPAPHSAEKMAEVYQQVIQKEGL